MTETFSENVVIDGASDVIQLRVQGHTTQTQPLQDWEDSSGETLVRVTGDGKIQAGDLGLSTPTALIEASADLTPVSSMPRRGVHALGRFTGVLTEALTWAVHEFELLGSGGIDTLQTALRAKITNQNTGAMTNAELRAAEFEAANEKGGSGNAAKQITGVRGIARNAAGAHTAKSVGIEATIANDIGGVISEAAAFEVATPTNSGTYETLYGLRVPDLNQGTHNYALYTGEGIVHLGDHQELPIAAETPSGYPPTGFIALYPKLADGVPVLWAKDSVGNETQLGGPGSETSAFHINVSGEIASLTEKGAPATADWIVIEDSAASNAKKKVQLGNLPGATGGGPSPDVNFLQVVLYAQVFG